VYSTTHPYPYTEQLQKLFTIALDRSRVREGCLVVKTRIEMMLLMLFLLSQC
jgi:hypothetical protein